MPYESTDKMVSHPAHYQSNGMEVIDVIESFTSDLTGIEAVDTANVIKYICRWKHKNGIQDLEKARWYLEHLIEHMKGKNEEPKSDEQNDILMKTVCSLCGNAVYQCWDTWTLSDCEKYCHKYYSCEIVATANDILRKKEIDEK